MTNFVHNIYKNDPVLSKSYVNKRCSVTTTDKVVHTGIVYTIDPVSESVVLVDEANDTNRRLKIVIGHAIERIDVISEDAELELPLLFQQTAANKQITETVIADRKRAVMNLLTENRFPAIEFADIIKIEDIVSIKPPYGPEDCISTNSIVLTRIHDILSQIK